MAEAAPLVSVVIPTYNRRELLKETIQSVLDQSYTPIEIIVIDDGSTDGTTEALADLASAGRIRYLRQENRGLGNSRNCGLGMARGEFVSFLDDDDLITPTKVAWQVAFLLQHPDVAVIGGSHAVLGAESEAEHGPDGPPEHWTFERVVTRNPFISPGVALMRTEAVRSVGGFDEQLWATDDWDVWLRITKFSRVMRLPRLALRYRLHEGNSSGNTQRMLASCAALIRRHLHALPAELAAPLWREASRHLYDGLGSMLVSRARQAVGRGRLVRAGTLLAGLRPIAGDIAGDHVLRRAVLRNLMGH